MYLKIIHQIKFEPSTTAVGLGALSYFACSRSLHCVIFDLVRSDDTVLFPREFEPLQSDPEIKAGPWMARRCHRGASSTPMHSMKATLGTFAHNGIDRAC